MPASLTMLIEWDGKTYEYNPARISVKTAIAIKDYTGLGLRSWGKAVDDADPAALQGLLFAIKAQANEPALIAMLEFSPVEFFAEISRASLQAMTDELEREQAADEDAKPGPDEDPTETSTS